MGMFEFADFDHELPLILNLQILHSQTFIKWFFFSQYQQEFGGSYYMAYGLKH